MMRRSLLLLVTFCLALCSSLDAQDVPAKAPKRLAPGILKVIPPTMDARDSVSLPMPLPGLNAQPFKPKLVPVQETLFGQTRKIVFYRDVWQYEVAMTGLRQMRLRTDTANGAGPGSNIFYMIYRIRNMGKSLSYKKVKEDPRFEQIKHQLVRDDEAKSAHKDLFLPRFSLEGLVVDENRQYQRVTYRDQILPQVRQLIQQQEDPNRVLLDTLGMSQAKIPLAKSEADDGVWGVAIWKNVNPKIDFISVFVNGTTNAFRLVRNEDGSIGRTKRVLQLNFWRPGDSVYEADDEIRYGIPLVDVARRQVEIARRYNLPGPLIRGYRLGDITDRKVLVVEADAEFDLNTFRSTITPKLDAGELPESLADAFADSGVSVPEDATVSPILKGYEWSIEADGVTYGLKMEPQFWEPAPGGGIRFIKRLDHLWIYR